VKRARNFFFGEQADSPNGSNTDEGGPVITSNPFYRRTRSVQPRFGATILS
jgi:hypothetical protein